MSKTDTPTIPRGPVTPAAAETGAPQSEHRTRRRRPIRWASFRDLLLVPPIIIVLAVGFVVNEKFLSSDNLTNVLTAMSGISLIVLAEVFVLIVGKMDLSLESTFGLAPGIAIWATMGTSQVGAFVWAAEWMAIPMALLVGAIIGLVNGLLIVKFGLNGFIVTLAMLIALRGLLTFITGGFTLTKIPSAIDWLGNGTLLGIPVNIIISVGLFAIGYLVLGYTTVGRSLYAIGGNQAAARAAGIRTDNVVIGVLVIAGLLAALGGLIYSGQFASVQVSQGDGMIFQVFAACVIGGVALNGGRGSVVGAFCGILILTLIQKLLSYGGVSADSLKFINGGLILVALIITRLASGRRQD
ncbi:ABC transporter permease [Gordonia rhizosphera]|uniref:Putative sugar ABC transporter permease protein n=1 Tax=Gordonia rhizosphera NBRC 16068 TaxID=1108045 RepID=K6WHD6_9ACTN|nr:ABC transporter permease [Gordonia rhizosphera]GAB93191.1 putative sugar ABC transporter permease protein [Gordonia rhizosphera NBRC 16068]